MRAITLYSFGYYGWGTSTPKLVEAVDAIEKSRGFRPPLFVDIRIRRAVRAVGFSGATFEELVGRTRYRWMKELGNRQIVTKSGPRVQVANPNAAGDLVELALHAAEDNRQVIFFCGCPWPREEGKIACHRATVSTLVLAAARRRGVRIEIVEWPGGAPRLLSTEVPPPLFRSIKNGRMLIPMSQRADLGELNGPPWGSIATFNCGGDGICRIVGPAIWHRGEWCLQVLYYFFDPDVGLRQYWGKSFRILKAFGLDPRK